MKLAEAKDIVNNSEIINPNTEHSFVKGCYGKKYLEAITVLAYEHKDDSCPSNLVETKVLEHRGFKCKIHYNYVPPYNIGILPANHWFATLEDKRATWGMAFDDDIKSLEDACNKTLPVLKVVVDRWYKKNN